MKIFILPAPGLLQPEHQNFRYPAHNKDYGVEQDFYIWLKKQPRLLTNNPNEADWHYLPIYWTRWYINHDFAENNRGIDELQNEVDKILIDHRRTFTISQFDGGILINSQILVFTAARTENQGIDIPILCSKHIKPVISPAKKYLASFNGSLYTHAIREQMRTRFADDPRVPIGGTLPTRFLKRKLWGTNYNLQTLASYIALCPRGTSCNSFRFFESMQLGVAPCLIGDVDARPFKKFIPWDEISYYAPTIDDLQTLLQNLNKQEALKKGKAAYQYWKKELSYQKWCKYIIAELESIN